MTSRQAKQTNAKKQQPSKAKGIQKPARKDSHKRRGLKLKLSKAAKEYFHSLCDPFGSKPSTIPDFPTVPSRRLKTFTKGFFNVGTAGFGFVMGRPLPMSASDTDCIVFSTGAYAGLTLANGGAGTVLGYSNADYLSATFGATATNYRIVSCGIRIRYAGTELNRGGTISGVTAMQHQNLTGLNFGQIDTMPNSRRFHPMGGKWYTTLYCPVLVNELQWSFGVAPVSTTGGYMAFVVQGQSGDVYEYEMYSNIEYNGPNVRGQLPGLADPTGLAVVHTGVNSTGMPPTDRPVEQVENVMMKQVEKASNSVVTTLVDTLIESDPLVELTEAGAFFADEVLQGLALLGFA